MRLSDFKQEENEDIIEKYNQLKDLPQEELSSKLFEEVARQKQAGTFNAAMLYQTIESMKSYMPQETYINMLSLLDSFNDKK